MLEMGMKSEGTQSKAKASERETKLSQVKSRIQPTLFTTQRDLPSVSLLQYDAIHCKEAHKENQLRRDMLSDGVSKIAYKCD